MLRGEDSAGAIEAEFRLDAVAAASATAIITTFFSGALGDTLLDALTEIAHLSGCTRTAAPTATIITTDLIIASRQAADET